MRGLCSIVLRGSAIEPAIGHIKTYGKLARSWFNGARGHATHVVLRGADHSLQIFYSPIQELVALMEIA